MTLQWLRLDGEQTRIMGVNMVDNIVTNLLNEVEHLKGSPMTQEEMVEFLTDLNDWMDNYFDKNPPEESKS